MMFDHICQTTHYWDTIDTLGGDHHKLVSKIHGPPLALLDLLDLRHSCWRKVFSKDYGISAITLDSSAALHLKWKTKVCNIKLTGNTPNSR